MWPLILFGVAAWAARQQQKAAVMGDNPMQSALDQRTQLVVVPQMPWGKAVLNPGVADPSRAITYVAKNRTIPGTATGGLGVPNLIPIPPLSELMEFDVMVAKPDPAAHIPIDNPLGGHRRSFPDNLTYGRTD